MTPDDLDTKSLEELDRIFAVELAGWSPHAIESKKCHDPEGLSCYWDDVPPFSSSADAILPWLEKHGVEIHRVHRIKTGYVWEVSVYYDGSYFPVEATAPTFPHAAVKALIRAERAKKGNV